MNHFNVVETNNGWYVEANARMGEMRDGKTYVFVDSLALSEFFRLARVASTTALNAQKERP